MTLSALGNEPMMPQLRKNPSKVLGMGFIIRGEDEDVVEVDNYKVVK